MPTHMLEGSGCSLNPRGVILSMAAAQVLLAIASGAWLLSPSWVEASMQAGAWLPEIPYTAEVNHLLAC